MRIKSLTPLPTRFHRIDHMGLLIPSETITLLEGYEEEAEAAVTVSASLAAAKAAYEASLSSVSSGERGGLASGGGFAVSAPSESPVVGQSPMASTTTTSVVTLEPPPSTAPTPPPPSPLPVEEGGGGGSSESDASSNSAVSNPQETRFAQQMVVSHHGVSSSPRSYLQTCPLHELPV